MNKIIISMLFVPMVAFGTTEIFTNSSDTYPGAYRIDGTISDGNITINDDNKIIEINNPDLKNQVDPIMKNVYELYSQEQALRQYGYEDKADKILSERWKLLNKRDRLMGDLQEKLITSRRNAVPKLSSEEIEKKKLEIKKVDLENQLSQ